LAAVHTPMTDLALPGSVGVLPSRDRSFIGTCNAMVWTFTALVVLMPADAPSGMRWRSWNGRSTPRSKIAPRST
jgi:hypothetical protein